MICRRCGAELEKNSKFCAECGAKCDKSVNVKGGFCVNCGVELNKTTRFCYACGEKVRTNNKMYTLEEITQDERKNQIKENNIKKIREDNVEAIKENNIKKIKEDNVEAIKENFENINNKKGENKEKTMKKNNTIKKKNNTIKKKNNSIEKNNNSIKKKNNSIEKNNNIGKKNNNIEKENIDIEKENKVDYDDKVMERFENNIEKWKKKKEQRMLEEQKAKEELERKKGLKIESNKIRKIAISVAAVCVITSSVFVVRWYLNPERKVMVALEEKQYDNALSEYKEIEGEETPEFIKILKERIEEIKSDYLNDNIMYDEANNELNVIKEMKIEEIEENLTEAINYVDELNVSKQAFETAETMYENGNYINAISNYNKVIKEDINYEETQKKLVLTKNMYRRSVINETDNLLNTEEYSKAKSCVSEGLKILTDDKKLKDKLQECENKYKNALKKETLEKVKELEKTEDYEEAIEVLNNAIKEIGNDAKLKAKLQGYTSLYVDGVLKDVDNLIKNKKYSEAKQRIEVAREIVPKNEALKYKNKEIEKSMPKSLTLLKGDKTNNWIWNKGKAEDVYGKKYKETTNYIVFENNLNEKNSNEYMTNGKYVKLTGSYVPYKNMKKNTSGKIKIYADNKMVYASENITEKTKLQTFSVNINKAKKIKIEIEASNYETAIMLMDMEVWKQE